MGGTGKTPQIEYLIRLLSTGNKVATLSRGYKRKSKGFLLANENSTAASLGDEPYQMHLKFPNIQVAVDIGEYGSWFDWPYLQISMGYGRLFSFLFSLGKIGFTFDIAGRNWRDELFYVKEVKE